MSLTHLLEGKPFVLVFVNPYNNSHEDWASLVPYLVKIRAVPDCPAALVSVQKWLYWVHATRVTKNPTLYSHFLCIFLCLFVAIVSLISCFGRSHLSLVYKPSQCFLMLATGRCSPSHPNIGSQAFHKMWNAIFASPINFWSIPI